ncbi:MAG: hypothetical protein JW881_13055 [Spirochaetales bacterium]|nr:hypothetical protein [Spirochaetales bacterium]
MIKNEIVRMWVNRVFAFLAGGLTIFIILQFTTVSYIEGQNTKLNKELDQIKYEPGRLFEQGKTYFENNDYNNAKRILNTLFEKHPISKETAEGRALYVKIEEKQKERDKKWDAAVGGIRKEWAKSMAIQLKEKFEREREQLEKDMDSNLDREWERMKNEIRKEWEKQI